MSQLNPDLVNLLAQQRIKELFRERIESTTTTLPSITHVKRLFQAKQSNQGYLKAMQTTNILYNVVYLTITKQVIITVKNNP